MLPSRSTAESVASSAVEHGGTRSTHPVPAPFAIERFGKKWPAAWSKTGHMVATTLRTPASSSAAGMPLRLSPRSIRPSPVSHALSVTRSRPLRSSVSSSCAERLWNADGRRYGWCVRGHAGRRAARRADGAGREPTRYGLGIARDRRLRPDSVAMAAEVRRSPHLPLRCGNRRADAALVHAARPRRRPAGTAPNCKDVANNPLGRGCPRATPRSECVRPP